MFWVSKFLGFNVRGVLSKERNWKLRNKKATTLNLLPMRTKKTDGKYKQIFLFNNSFI
jgi:hypothetical protein